MVPVDHSGWRTMDLEKKKEPGCCSVRCLKTPMHMFTFFYWLTGVALVVVGAWTLIYRSEYAVLLEGSWFLIIVGLMIGTGGLIMIVCLCGCYGVVKEHRYFLVSFLILLTLIFVIECSIGIAAFIHRAQVEDDLAKTTMKRMNEYGTSDDVKESFDLLQQRHMCCGDVTYSSWNVTSWRQLPENANLSVPDSCCKTMSPSCGRRDHPSNIYHKGCISRLSEFVSDQVFILGLVALVLSAFQLTGIVLTACILRFVEYY